VIQSERPALSIVIPIFNEEENVPILADEIRQALDPHGIAYEVVAVDDGSTDGSWSRLERSGRRTRGGFSSPCGATSGRRRPSRRGSIMRAAKSSSRSTGTCRTTRRHPATPRPGEGLRYRQRLAQESARPVRQPPAAVHARQLAHLQGDRHPAARLRMHAESVPARDP